MMFQRLYLQGVCLFTPKNASVMFNAANSPLRLVLNNFQNSVHIFGVKSTLSQTNTIPITLEYALQLKTVARGALKNGLKRSCVLCRNRQVNRVWCAQPSRASVLKCISGQNIFVRLFGRFLRCHFTKNKGLARIALGSALFVPSTFFRSEPVAEVKPHLIEIPKEIKKPKSKSFFVHTFLIAYEFLRLVLRGLRLFFTFVPILAVYPVTFFGETPTEAWWGLLLKAIEFSGPILIKFGQWASTRRDLFPDSCCRQFARLQRRIQPHSWTFTKYRMRKAFGPNWRKVFVKFDNDLQPVGSGCVAQVYKVWMAKDAVPDQELLEEIVSDLDDGDSLFEALEIQGFRSLFGFDDEEKDERDAMNDWEVNREVERARERDLEEKERKSRETDEKPPSQSEMDVSSLTESVASGIVSGEGFLPPSVTTEEVEVEHPLVEVWNEADHDKSLPVKDAPPDDMDELIPVAVKVLHPSVHTCFRRDLRILKACATFITFVYPPLRWLSLPQCVDEFSEVMSPQINLIKEAKNLEYFTDYFSDVLSVRFPRPLRPFVTQKVMVETFEDGEFMSEFLGTSGEDKPDDLKRNLAKIGVDALLKMIFVDNFVHGDMHPGNMLIQNITINEDGISEKETGDVTRIMMVDVGCDTFVMDVQPDPNPLRICLLDCGLVARLKEGDLANFKAVFKQVVLGDGESVADLFLENSEHSCKDPEAFKTDMTLLVETARQNTITLGQVDVGILLQQVLATLLKHQIRLESAFSSVVLAVFVLEGLGRTLDPEMDILERARPILVTGKIN